MAKTEPVETQADEALTAANLRIAELEGQLAQTDKERIAAADELAALQARYAGDPAADEALTAANARIAELEGQLAEALAAQPTPRSLTLPEPGEGEEAAPVAGDTLLERIAQATLAEIRVSDGVHELSGCAPLTVTAADFAVRPSGLVMTKSFVVSGPAPGSAAETVRAYALVLDGTVAAVQQRFEPLELPAGLTMSLSGDVVF